MLKPPCSSHSAHTSSTAQARDAASALGHAVPWTLPGLCLDIFTASGWKAGRELHGGTQLTFARQGLVAVPGWLTNGFPPCSLNLLLLCASCPQKTVENLLEEGVNTIPEG